MVESARERDFEYALYRLRRREGQDGRERQERPDGQGTRDGSQESQDRKNW